MLAIPILEGFYLCEILEFKDEYKAVKILAKIIHSIGVNNLNGARATFVIPIDRELLPLIII